MLSIHLLFILIHDPVSGVVECLTVSSALIITVIVSTVFLKERLGFVKVLSMNCVYIGNNLHNTTTIHLKGIKLGHFGGPESKIDNSKYLF